MRNRMPGCKHIASVALDWPYYNVVITQVGAGWNATWGDLTPEANDECCACGGGETPGADGDDSPEIDMMAVTPGCVDLPGTDGKAWTDTKGHACSKYEESLWCLPDGEVRCCADTGEVGWESGARGARQHARYLASNTMLNNKQCTNTRNNKILL